MTAIDETFMNKALQLAHRAADEGNMGCGAVLVRNGDIVGEGMNTVCATGDPTDHAETRSIRDAVRRGNRLEESTLYTTMEPCPMCLWAAVISGVGRLVIGCRHSALEVGIRTDLADYTTEALLKLTGRRMDISFGVRAFECEAVRRRPFGQSRS